MFYSLVLPHMNKYWDVRLQGWAREAPVTTAEKVIAGIGIGLWVLWVAVITLTVALLVVTQAN